MESMLPQFSLTRDWLAICRIQLLLVGLWRVPPDDNCPSARLSNGALQTSLADLLDSVHLVVGFTNRVS